MVPHVAGSWFVAGTSSGSVHIFEQGKATPARLVAVGVGAVCGGVLCVCVCCVCVCVCARVHVSVCVPVCVRVFLHV